VPSWAVVVVARCRVVSVERTAPVGPRRQLAPVRRTGPVVPRQLALVRCTAPVVRWVLVWGPVVARMVLAV